MYHKLQINGASVKAYYKLNEIVRVITAGTTRALLPLALPKSAETLRGSSQLNLKALMRVRAATFQRSTACLKF